MTSREAVHKALIELAEDVEMIVLKRIAQYGVNPKTGTNTLQGSELEKSLKIIPEEDGLTLQIASYWEFVSRGWKRTHNYEGTMSQFVRNVNDWVRRKGISLGKMTQSQMVWVIIKNIMENGLKSRPFLVYDEEGDLEKMIPELKAYMDKWFDDLFGAITRDLDNYFKAA